MNFVRFEKFSKTYGKTIEKSESKIENFGRKLRTLTKIEKMLRSKFYTFFRIILMVSFLVASQVNKTVFKFYLMAFLVCVANFANCEGSIVRTGRGLSNHNVTHIDDSYRRYEVYHYQIQMYRFIALIIG